MFFLNFTTYLLLSFSGLNPKKNSKYSNLQVSNTKFDG